MRSVHLIRFRDGDEIANKEGLCKWKSAVWTQGLSVDGPFPKSFLCLKLLLHLKSKPLTEADWTLYSLAPGIHAPLSHQRLGHSYLSAFALSVMSARNSRPTPCFHSGLISEAIFSEAALGHPVQGTGHPTPPPESPAALSHLVMFPLRCSLSECTLIIYRLLVCWLFSSSSLSSPP